MLGPTRRQPLYKLPRGGVVIPGNIDINNRPQVRNPDGSISTVRSISIGTDNGEVLLPTIGPKGQDWTSKEAIAAYYRTGQNLGTFATPKLADAYASALHDQQAQLIQPVQPKGERSVLGMFGNRPRRTMAEQGMMGAMPETLAAPQLQTMPMPQMPAQPMPQQGMRPTGARRVAGLLSSFVSGALGAPDRYGDGIRQQQEQQRQLQLQQQLQAEQRAYEESQWRARQEYARANPEPDAFMRSMVAAGIDPNSDQGRALLSQRVTNMADPMQTINNGDGTYTMIRTSQLQRQTAPASSPAAPDTLPPDFDFGGPTPTASGGFPPYR